jgi:hypothetical protein
VDRYPTFGEFPYNLFQLIISGNLIGIPQPYLLQAQFNTLPGQEIDWLCAACTLIPPGQTITSLKH